ncbi:MAG TPA: glycosyltransferase [Terriglobia bacterium]|nr:glycosyltransferase [Terriglobia bacterium]
MKVSVCIPTYNASEYLRECIESVLSQTFKNIEIIVSDNASTDSTCEIVRSYSDPRIQLYRLDRNEGMAFNFNHAGSLAHGEYVKFLCADDLLEPACVEKQAELLDRHPEIIIASAGVHFIDPAGRRLRTHCWVSRETVLNQADVIARNLVYGNVIGNPSAVLIRRKGLLKAGPFSANLPQGIDVEMWLRLMDLGPVGFLPEPLCGFRLHQEAMTERLRKEGLIRQDVLRVTQMMLGRVTPSLAARRACWGRVAGSYLKQMMAGLRSGHLRWPLAALWQAFRIDPAFAGLMIHLFLLRPGLVGLRVQGSSSLKLRLGSTLREQN